MNQRRSRKQIVACNASDLLPGQRLILELDGKSIGVFNVDGRYFALHNRCPHMGGTLCEGPLTGTALATDQYHFEYSRQGQIQRCGWHGWEFDVKTGQALVDPLVRARTYPVTVENGSLVVHI
jgi:nitrite reductase/ring-hydroxylating ferredoxin subunit